MPAKTDQVTVTGEVVGDPIEQDFLPATIDANLATADATPAPLVDPDDPWADVGDGDLTGEETSRLPFLELNRKVGQPKSGFFDPDTGEKTLTLDFYWLAASYSRAQWNEAFNPKSEDPAPRCRSFDGHTSDPLSPDRKATDCATCPFNRWDGDHTTRCNLSMEAMIFLADTTPGAGRLMKVRFGGMAATAARDYWRSFKTRLPKRPAMAFLTRATLVETETDNGTFLVPRFERVFELDRSMAQPLVVERDRYMAAWKLDIADAVMRQSAEGENGNGKAKTTGEDSPAETVYGSDGEPF